MDRVIATTFLSVLSGRLLLGGGAKAQASATTMGQELMDMDDTCKKGILNEEKYEAKKQIMERYEK